jgi:NADH:ubiquinone reductase (H+-translocating)
MQIALFRSQRNGWTRSKGFGSLPCRIGDRPSPRLADTAIRQSFHFHRKPPVIQTPRLRSIAGVPIPHNRTIWIRQMSELSDGTQKIRRRPLVRFLYHIFAYCGFFIVGSGLIVFAFFLYDASTYREGPSAEDLPMSELALQPRRGGPKHLPIAEVLVDDEDSRRKLAQKDKPKLVILGTGWGSVALLKTLDPGEYHVTVVSPANYFLFTPMLPSATVGTLGLRSLVEPIRRIVHRIGGHFLKAEAEDVDFSSKLVEVSQVDSNGIKQHFYLPYDKLVVAVGMLV